MIDSPDRSGYTPIESGGLMIDGNQAYVELHDTVFGDVVEVSSGVYSSKSKIRALTDIGDVINVAKRAIEDGHEVTSLVEFHPLANEGSTVERTMCTRFHKLGMFLVGVSTAVETRRSNETLARSSVTRIQSKRFSVGRFGLKKALGILQEPK